MLFFLSYFFALRVQEINEDLGLLQACEYDRMIDKSMRFLFDVNPTLNKP